MRPIRKLAIGLWLAVFLFAGIRLGVSWKQTASEGAANRTDNSSVNKTVELQPAVENKDSPPAGRVGQPLPAIRLKDIKGESRDLATWSGRTLLINFWATWCAPCRKSMPELQALHAKFVGRGFTVVGVSIDEGKEATRKVRKFVASKGIAYPVAIDAASAPAWERFRVKAVPAAFLVDRDGRIVAQWTGRSADAAVLEQTLERMLAQID